MEQLAVPEYSRIVKAIATGSGLYACAFEGWRIVEKKDSTFPLGRWSLTATSIELAKSSQIFVPGYDPLSYDDPLLVGEGDVAIDCSWSGAGGLKVAMKASPRSGHVLLYAVSDPLRNILAYSMANHEAEWIVPTRLNPLLLQ